MSFEVCQAACSIKHTRMRYTTQFTIVIAKCICVFVCVMKNNSNRIIVKQDNMIFIDIVAVSSTILAHNNFDKKQWNAVKSS